MGQTNTVDVVRCVTPNTGAEEMVLAADQPQYEEVVVAKYLSYAHLADGVLAAEPVPMMLYRFHPDARQRAAIVAGEDLFLAVLTFGRPPLPLQLSVGAGAYEITEQLARDPGDRGLTRPDDRP